MKWALIVSQCLVLDPVGVRHATRRILRIGGSPFLRDIESLSWTLARSAVSVASSSGRAKALKHWYFVEMSHFINFFPIKRALLLPSPSVRPLSSPAGLPRTLV